MTAIEELKFNLREKTHPWFDEIELQSLLDKNKIGEEDDGIPIYDINKASYEGLLMKSEAKEFKLGDTIIANDSKYWIRLARQYRSNNTGTIKRADGRL